MFMPIWIHQSQGTIYTAQRALEKNAMTGTMPGTGMY